MSESVDVRRRSADAVRLSELAAIFEEEGYARTEVLAEDLTYGQARGIAGRKRTQLLKRLRDIGFVVADADGGPAASTIPIQVDCDLVWIPPILFGLKCHIRIGTSSTK